MKMQIKCGVEANEDVPYGEHMLWSVVGNYICVGFADLHSGWQVPVWRKLKR